MFLVWITTPFRFSYIRYKLYRESHVTSLCPLCSVCAFPFEFESRILLISFSTSPVCAFTNIYFLDSGSKEYTSYLYQRVGTFSISKYTRTAFVIISLSSSRYFSVSTTINATKSPSDILTLGFTYDTGYFTYLPFARFTTPMLKCPTYCFPSIGIPCNNC